MRVFIDTNILFSAILNPNSTPYKAYLKAVTLPNKGIISDQNITESRRIFNRKSPSKYRYWKASWLLHYSIKNRCNNHMLIDKLLNNGPEKLKQNWQNSNIRIMIR